MCHGHPGKVATKLHFYLHHSCKIPIFRLNFLNKTPENPGNFYVTKMT